MLELTKIELSVTGIWNGRLFSGSGILKVNPADGTKQGAVVYDTTPPGAPDGDTGPVATVRCFIGARHAGQKDFLGPLELLGRDFVSVRSTTVGRTGFVSVGETARTVRDVLHTDLTVVGNVRVPRIRGMGPLSEVATVSGDDTLICEGRYSFVTKGGRTIPIRYTHLYRSLHPNRRLFRRMRGQRFLLRSNTSARVRGRQVEYRSQSTVRRLEAR